MPRHRRKAAEAAPASPPGQAAHDDPPTTVPPAPPQAALPHVEHRLTLEGKRWPLAQLIAGVNSRYPAPLWRKYAERHEVSADVFDAVTAGTYFDKHATGLAYLETLYDSAMAHSTTMRANPVKFVDQFLTPKLNRFLAEHHQAPVAPKSYVEYITTCISKNYLPALDVRWTAKSGWGLFAAEELQLFDFIGLYVGELAFLPRLPAEVREHNQYLCTFPLKEAGLVANAEAVGNYTRLINHSPAHNLFCIHLSINKVPYMVLISSGIASNAEILWNYGDNYHKPWEAEPA
eukprot:EG_transcript_17793